MEVPKLEVPSANPFRFSMQAVRTSSRTKWVELVRRVDDAGFDMIVTADHLGDSLSPLLPLAVAAQVSDRLRLGVMVLNNDLSVFVGAFCGHLGPVERWSFGARPGSGSCSTGV